MQNLFHLLTERQQAYAQKALHLVSIIFAMSRACASVDILEGREILRNIEAEIGEPGMIMTALQYLTMKDHGTPFESIVDPRLVDCFEMICHYFDDTVSSQIKVDEKKKHREATIKIKGSIDIVPAITCEGFPDTVAADWSNRVASKNWPETRIVNEVLKGGFHLVPKTSMCADADADADSDADVDFRISFSSSQAILSHSLSNFQKECYHVFKMYHYDHLRSKPAVLDSYHLKTVFFWLLEEIESTFWCEENRASIFYLLMNKLLNHLRNHELPRYFIPENNLFQHLDGEELYRLEQVVESRMRDSSSKMGETIKEMMEYYRLKCQRKKEDRGQSFHVIDEDFVREQSTIKEKAFQTLADLAAAEKRFEVHGNFLNSEDVNALLADTKTRSLLTFCFDVIYAKHVMQVMDGSYEDNKANFLYGPEYILILLGFPLTGSIVKEVFCRVLDNDSYIMKQLNLVEQFIEMALSNDSNDWIDTALKLSEIFPNFHSRLCQSGVQVAGQTKNGLLDPKQISKSLAVISELFGSDFLTEIPTAEKKRINDYLDLD